MAAMKSVSVIFILVGLLGCFSRVYLHDQLHNEELKFEDIRIGSGEGKSTGTEQFNEFQIFKRVCYLRMDPKSGIEFEHIDGNLCTYIIYAFCRIDSDGNVIFGAESDGRYLNDVPRLKAKYPHLKVLVSLYNEGEFQGFAKASQSESIRERLAQSAIEFMDRYHIDGMDLDWEFPNFPPKVKFHRKERSGFTQIVAALRMAFGNKYLLTSAVAAQETVMKASYELGNLANYLDWFNVMTYDYYLYKFYTPITGPNSPLHPVAPSYVPLLNHLSIHWTIETYIKKGIPKEKIVMGIPTYARGFKLLLPSKSSTPKGFMKATGAKGGNEVSDYFNYREVCEMLAKPDTRTAFDEKARVPYLISGKSLWVSYEDERSVREKVAYAVDMNLGGYMTWNLNSDNFKDGCTTGESRRNILHSSMLDQARTMLER